MHLASATAIVAGIATAAISFLGTYGFHLFNLIDALILFGLAYGVYRKSRTSAIVLLVYHLGNRLNMYQRTGDLNVAFGLVAIAITVIYFLGVLGTFAFHAPSGGRNSGPASS